MELNAKQREFPIWRAVRRKFPADNPFFFAGNVDRELLAKQVSLDITEEEKSAISLLVEEQNLTLFCPIVGCGAKLKRVADLDAHYVQRHMAACSTCRNVFPTTRLLNLHVSETHDSFFRAKVARNFPMYECLVERCPGRFLSDAQRLQHLVDKHQFPRSFSFHSKKHLSQRQRQRHKQSAYKQPHESQTCSQRKPLSSKFQPKETKEDTVPSLLQEADTMQDDQGLDLAAVVQNDSDVSAMDYLTSAVSRLSTASKATEDIPTVVSFGRKTPRGYIQPPVHPIKSNPLLTIPCIEDSS